MINRISLNNHNTILKQENNKQIKKNEETQKLSRVEELKKAIENGEYKVDIKKTAKALAKALMK